MSLPTWTTGCCTQEVPMGKKRDRKCEHGRVYEKVRADGTTRPPLRQTGKGFEASPAQREKVEDQVCVNCGKEAIPGVLAIDPAHVWPRSKGGCDHEDCVVPLCRLIATGQGCHRDYDDGKLDLLPELVRRGYFVELAHPIAVHEVSPTRLLDEVTSNSYGPLAPLEKALGEEAEHVAELEALLESPVKEGTR